MKPKIRALILEHLGKNQVATTRELSQAGGVSEADIRYHLTQLGEAGVVEVRGKKQDGRGRPTLIFGLPPAETAGNIAILTMGLIHEYFDGVDFKEGEARLRRLASRMVGEKEIPGNQLTIRLSECVEKMSALHYQARWQAGVDGARVSFGNCPFAAIILQCPVLCKLDISILETLLGAEVVQVSKLEKGSRGERTCSFKVLYFPSTGSR